MVSQPGHSRLTVPHPGAGTAAVVFLVGALSLARLHGYLLFHSLVELFTITVACSAFFLAWNARRFLDNHSILLIGISSLFVGSIDALHLLAYKGMGVIGEGANLPTQLWITARYLQSASLLAAPLFLHRKLRPGATFAVFAAVLTLLAAVFAAGWFPDCYSDAGGLTWFKIASEYVVTATLLTAGLLFYRGRACFEPLVFQGLAASILLMAAAELCFTVYVDIYGPANATGHLLRFLAFSLLYQAVIVTGLVRPHELLFRNLTRSEETLRRTLAEVKTLSGLLPICAHCKKVRDDHGYWTQVESYLAKRSDVLFSHGICPDCLVRFYPDYPPDSEPPAG
jgi:hypothetical protein